MTPPKPPTQMCATCFHVLYPTQPMPEIFPGLVVYAHSQPKLDNHKPIPVTFDHRVIEVCDFCTTGVPLDDVTVFETEKYRVAGWLGGDDSYADDGAWTSCPTCTALLLQEPPDYEAIIARALEVQRPQALLIGSTTREHEFAVRSMVIDGFAHHWTGKSSRPGRR